MWRYYHDRRLFYEGNSIGEVLIAVPFKVLPGFLGWLLYVCIQMPFTLFVVTLPIAFGYAVNPTLGYVIAFFVGIPGYGFVLFQLIVRPILNIIRFFKKRGNSKETVLL